MQFRLKDNHPLMRKLEQLYDLADQLNLSIEFLGIGTTVRDHDTGKEYFLSDLDNEAIMDWPPAIQYKLTYDK